MPENMEMNEKPILFSGPMVQAILDGRKTQTRRVVKMDEHVRDYAIRFVGDDFGQWFYIDSRFPSGAVKYPFALNSPYGKPGDRLWVRETFQPLWTDENKFNDERDYKTGHGYYVNYPATDGVAEWHDFYREEMSNACKPSIFMPRWASRITLEITGVRVERLNEISTEDAQAEGVEPDGMVHIAIPGKDIQSYPSASAYQSAFAQLWEKINGKKHPWASNPWVWVMEFKKI